MGWFREWWSGVGAALKAFFASEGGQILQRAAANGVRLLTAQGMNLLVLMASRYVGGQKLLSTDDWARISREMQAEAFKQGLAMVPELEALIDQAIGTAVAANAAPPA